MVTAANGLEALQRVRDQVPEVIVLDLQMPVMSGQEFLAAWRSSMPTTSIPVVAISGHHLGVRVTGPTETGSRTQTG